MTAAQKPPVAANPVVLNIASEGDPREGNSLGVCRSAAAVMLRVELRVWPEVAGKVTLGGVREQEILTAAEGAPHVRFTVPVKPFMAVTVTFDVPAWPAAAAEVTNPSSEKSPAGVAAVHAEISFATSKEPNPVT